MGRVIGFAGMTHLGLVSACAAAEKGFRVVAFDADTRKIEALRRGELPVSEPDLPELLQKNAGRIAFTAELAELGACDVLYVAADVPTDETGLSDLGPIRALVEAVGAAIPKDAVLVLLSQVPPGFTRGIAEGGRFLHYQVETLIFGRAVERALCPERFIVGCANPEHPLPAAYRAFLESFDCPILAMRYESAETAKIAINCFLTAQVTVTNTLAELCERTGGDWLEVAPALRLDRRIGPQAFLNPGLGSAGGNRARDLAPGRRRAAGWGGRAEVVDACLANSARRHAWIEEILDGTEWAAGEAATLAVLGLAYKENTASVKNSAALELLRAAADRPVRVYDPVVRADPAWHPDLVQAASPLEACEGAQALAIATPWPEFRDLDAAEIAKRLDGNLVVDPYRMLDEAACRAAGLRHHVLGAPAGIRAGA
jgi:UDPglucose 6-dehydrogenase